MAILLSFASMMSVLFAQETNDQTKEEGIIRRTQHWANNNESFNKMNAEIEDCAEFNLLTFPEAKLFLEENISASQLLTDGNAGVLGGEGRVAINGKPSKIIYYLGKPQSISAIRIFSGNIDTRGNQDFEIRLANNENEAGKMPNFPELPTLTSGETILGGNGGGFLTAFEKTDGSNLFDAKYDWVEFRFWQTYNQQAGQPGKSASQADSWGSMIEIQVLGDLNDPSLFKNEEERQKWFEAQNLKRFERKLDALGSEVSFAIKNRESLKLAIEDIMTNYPDEFENSNYLERWEDFDQKFSELAGQNNDDFIELAQEYEAFRREVLLSNPILDFDQILLRKTTNPALQPNWISNASREKGEYNDSLVLLDMNNLDAPLKEVARGPENSYIGDIALHWEADRCLVTALSPQKTWQVFECNLEDGSLTQKTPDMGGDVDNVEGCYVPDGSIIFISSASMMGVPCIGGTGLVGNIYRVEKDGKTVRQLTFEQDQDWCPTILPNGRIMYLRWEYVDIPHYYSRIMFTMNPDGTNQIEHYGSGSFWPNSTFYAKPIPGQSSKFVGIVSGHHGVAREGELVIFDPAKGRQETQGVVQRIPGRNNPPKNVTVDQLVEYSWPRFLFPSPLSDEYYIVACRMKPSDPWAIYLVDVFDNMLKLREEPGFALLEPNPIWEQDEPTILPDRTIPGEKEASVFITDVYFGQGLPDVPVGTVKSLRVFSVSYGYRGIGGHDVFGMESCWDGRRIIGEVPVFEDGSATFKIPANTPLVLQPLDENGAAVQTMRSWFVGMPGETESCIGCHETQNSVSPGRMTKAQKMEPMPINEFYGPERPFSFAGEIQPVLDQYCVGCHDGTEVDRPNFADTNPGPGGFSNAYHALHGYVRRPGPESDIHTFQPMEYHASTSELIQMLRKGHHNVEMDQEGWRKLYCWIDMNVPYFGTWTEIAEYRSGKGTNPLKTISDRYVELKNLYSGNDLNFEADSYYSEKNPQKVAFIQPKEIPEPDRSAPTVANWPFDTETAQKMQGARATNDDPSNEKDSSDLSVNHSLTASVSLEKFALPEKNEGDSAELLENEKKIEIKLVKIPAGSFVMGDENGSLDELPRTAATIEKPFWMMTTEVTNEMFALYDATHDSRYIDQWNKDHVLPGYPANKPQQPVIRISWAEAVGFCDWLSEKTGKKFRLPTEAEWEWAARSGSDLPFWFGDLNADFSRYENLADESTRLFVVAGVDPQPINHQDWQAFIPRANGINDGNMLAQEVGGYEANPWGLYDMFGSVAEWTLSDYKPYPYQVSDGRNNGDPTIKKVVRGGSWRDRPQWARAGLRRPYESWQKVYNVGFRVICEDDLSGFSK
ncbi:MAG: SUMF1/EgtB/PvdO family nonheme iron enzyme [Planctomycetia bacterium]|nr:SUMF1/EgtB/PvdO family nonheme iron enzyme [Planctomycetia bacterium]